MLLIGTTIDITTKGSRTSPRRRSTAASTCNCIAFVSVHSTSFGSNIPNDLFVGNRARQHFPTRSGSIDRSQPNKNQPKSQGNSQFHKQKCLIAIDTFRVALPGAALTPCYCRLLGCMHLICLCQSELVHAGRRPASQRRCCLGAALAPAPPSPSKKSVTEPDLNRSQCTSEVLFKATSGVVLGISAHAF